MKLDKAILAEALIRGAQADDADNKQRAQTITADESFKQYMQRALGEARDTRGLAASFGTMFDIGLEAGMLYRDIEKERDGPPDSSKALRTQISKYCDECPDLQLAFAKDRLLSIALVWTAPVSQASSEIRECDKMLNELGLRLYNAGDKEGWSICDDIGHKLRALAPSRQGAGGK